MAIEYKLCRNRKKGWRCFNKVLPGFKYCEECQPQISKQKKEKKLDRMPKLFKDHFVSTGFNIYSLNKTNIYFIQGIDGGPIKIGHAQNVSKRFSTLQIGCPIILKVLHTFKGIPMMEAILHEYFKDIRLHGEWFQPTESLLLFIENAKDGIIPEWLENIMDNPRF